jgi:hypothetical protein
MCQNQEEDQRGPEVLFKRKNLSKPWPEVLSKWNNQTKAGSKFQGALQMEQPNQSCFEISSCREQCAAWLPKIAGKCPFFNTEFLQGPCDPPPWFTISWNLGGGPSFNHDLRAETRRLPTKRACLASTR